MSLKSPEKQRNGAKTQLESQKKLQSPLTTNKDLDWPLGTKADFDKHSLIKLQTIDSQVEGRKGLDLANTTFDLKKETMSHMQKLFLT